MTTTSRRRAYGWRPDRPDPQDYMLHEHVALPAAAALPALVDLRATGHLGFDVYDQSRIGSCVSNGTGADLRYVASLLGLPDPDPSRLWLYYQTRKLEGNVGEDAGSEIRDALKVVAKLGCPPETDWPYDISRFAQKPPAQADADAKLDIATKYMRVAVSATSLKQALAAGFAVIVGFEVFPAIESDEVGETGILPMPGPNDVAIGGHAVLCVGYDDVTQRFLCRNSWGPDWGQAGYFEIPYAYLGSTRYASDFWAIQVIAEGGAPVPTPTDPLHELAALLRPFALSVLAWLDKHGL